MVLKLINIRKIRALEKYIDLIRDKVMKNAKSYIGKKENVSR